MSILNKNETEYINNLIRGGSESVLLDFKKEWYQIKNKNYAKDRFEFLKDCIAFLNVSIDLDRYIIIGIHEDKQKGIFNVCGTQESVEENNIQQLIENYIDPFPQIEILTNINYEGQQLNIIKIKKENRDQPYLFKKSFEKDQNNNFENKCNGLGYIRRGSSTGLLSRSDLSDLFYKKQRNIYGFFNIEAASKYTYFNKVMLFMECMNQTIDKESLDIISTNNSLFKYRLLEIFDTLIIQGELFNDLESNDYICNLIRENNDNFEKMDSFLDGGEHSLIISLFCISYSLYKVKSDKYFECETNNEVVIINFNKDNINKKGYDNINKIVNNCNYFILYINKIKYFYNNSKILKIRSIQFDEEVQQMFIQSDIKFRVSEDIIPLLIEPLYEHSNKMSVAFRELLQNAIDACKSTGIPSYKGIIEIEIIKGEKNDVLLFEDNGVGMDLEDISIHYLTVGKSKKKSSELAVVGQFGVGALSMFLIGKKVSVVTKKINHEFEYSFQLFEGNVETSDLKRIRVLNPRESYTKIKIELSNRIISSDINRLKKDFNIDKWALSNANNKVMLKYNNDEWIIPNIDLEREYFKKVYDSGSAKVYIFDQNEYSNRNNEDISTKELLSQKNAALFNDIGVNVSYKTEGFHNLKKDSIPFVVIIGKTTEKEYKIELSRNTAQIGKDISMSIVREIYNYNINKIKKYLFEQNNIESPIKAKMDIIQLVNRQIIAPEIILSKDKVTIVTPKNMTKLSEKYRFVYQIQANLIIDEWLNYDNHLYITDRLYTNKSDVANLIVSSNVICLSYRFLIKNILNAQNSNNGFRKAALEVVLKNVLPDELWEFDLASTLWEKIKQHKDLIKENMMLKVQKGLFYFEADNRNTIFNEKDFQHLDIIVLRVPISSLTNTDTLFNEIYEEKLFDSEELNTGIQVGSSI